MKSSREEQGERRKPSVYKAKEIEENNRMGKTRDLFKKTGDIKGTFHAMFFIFIQHFMQGWA